MAIGLVAITLTALAEPAGAHTPHDTVTGLAFSPTFAKDGKVFTVVSSRLLVSESGGYHWKPLVRGLPRPPESEETVATVAVAPTDPDTVYVSSRVGGVFRSDDGGSSWRQAAGGMARPDIIPIAVSPESPDVVLAAGTYAGLSRTVDGGAHWSAVPGISRVPAMAFVPATGRAVIGEGSGRVWVSDNQGATWKLVSSGQKASATAVAASAGPAPATVFVGDAKGKLSRSVDGGTTFAPIGTGLPVDQINSIALSPDFERDQTMWASLYEHGVYRSTDGGKTWSRTSRGLTHDIQAHQVKVAGFRTIVAARGRHGTVLYEGAFDGLFRSDDLGAHWRETQTLADYVVGLDVSPNYARDRSVAAATYVKGAYLSTDAGSRWQMIDHGLGERAGSGNKFATIRRLHNITFSPDYAQDDTIFSAGWTAFLKSTDRGQSWTPIQVGEPPPTALLRQYVLGVAPDYGKQHVLYLGTRQGDVFRSERAGDAGSWSRIGGAGSRVRSFAFDPSSDVIFAGTEAGVMRSDDGGATWTRTGPAGEAMVAISPDYTNDHTVFAGTADGLFVSRNGGSSWQPVRLPPGKIEALAMSPAYRSDHTILASVTGTGLFRSTDGARSFSPIGSDLLRENLVVSDFTNPSGTPIQFSPTYARDGTIFAYAGQLVLRSTDQGDTWTELRLPSAAKFLRALHTSDLTGAARGAVTTSDSGSISKRWLAGIAAAVLVVLAIVALWYFRRRRRRSATAGATPPDVGPADVGTTDAAPSTARTGEGRP